MDNTEALTKNNVSVIEAQWVLELNVYCPCCNEYVDLLDCPYDFWECGIEVIEHNTEKSDNLEVTCPKCGGEFRVRCVW